MGREHRRVAPSAWVAAAAFAGVSPGLILAGVGPAIVCASLPDIDNTRAAKRIDGIVNDEALGGCGPLNHRGLAHWIGLPAFAALWVYGLGDSLLAADPWRGGLILAVLWGAVIGWASHIAADFVFGQAGWGTPRGVPLAPWGWHVGLGFDADGRLASLAGYAAPAVAVTIWLLNY